MIVLTASLQRPKQVHLAQGEGRGNGEASLVDLAHLHFHQLSLVPLAEAARLSDFLGQLSAADSEGNAQRLTVSCCRIQMVHGFPMGLQHDSIRHR